MKKKLLLTASAMMAAGLIGTAAGEVPAADIECNEGPVEVCIGSDLVRAEITCKGGDWDEWDGIFIIDQDLEDSFGEFLVEVTDASTPADDEPIWVCGAVSWHNLLKTEGKCTDQPNGPSKGNKKWGPFAGPGYAVEYELKTVGECPD